MEIKRLGAVTCLRQGNNAVFIDGPWNPGGVWQATAHQLTPEFEKVWNGGSRVAIEFGVKMSRGMMWADSIFVSGSHNVIDYRYPTKRAAIEAATEYLQGDMPDLARELRGRMTEAVQRLVE